MERKRKEICDLQLSSDENNGENTTSIHGTSKCDFIKDLGGVIRNKQCKKSFHAKRLEKSNANAETNSGVKNVRMWNTLHIAASSGNLELLKQLLELKPDVNFQDVDGFTPLHFACKMNRLECVDLLLASGARSEIQDQHFISPLHIAVSTGDKMLLKKMLATSPDLNLQVNKSRTPLHLACIKSELYMIDLLLDSGAKPDLHDSRGMLPLHFPVKCRLRNLLLKMLSTNPNLNVQDRLGRTAMHVAAMLLNPDYINLFLDRGAKCDIIDSSGKTMAYYLLSLSGWDESSEIPIRSELCSRSHKILDQIERVLLRTNDVIIVDTITGQTPAHLVFANLSDVCYLELIKIVLTTQKDLNVKDKKKCTPLNYLTEKLHQFLACHIASELLQIFITKGCYLSTTDYDRVMKYDSVRDDIFGNADFCLMNVMNEFNLQTLPKFYNLVSSDPSFPSIDCFKLSCQMKRFIEDDIKSEINKKGICDIFHMKSTCLLKLCIECIISHHSNIIQTK